MTMRPLLFFLCVSTGLSAQDMVIGPDSQRGNNGFMVFRDQAEELWPVYLSAHADRRVDLSFDKNGLPDRGFSIRSTKVNQQEGNQSRRILGELIDGDGNPQVRFEVTRIANPPSGSSGKKSVSTAFLGTLTVGNASVPVRGELTVSKPQKADGVNAVVMWADFKVKGRDIGLRQHADRVIHCKIAANAAAQKKGKR